nr:hypothetical protein [Bacteroidota bacterium]
MEKNDTNELFSKIIRKATLKNDVYHNTYKTFHKFKTVIKEIVREYQETDFKPKRAIPFEYKNRGEFEVELKFAGDILVFIMHTNVFEFSRGHEVMKMPYVQEDKDRSYCGIINIYNFLGDSFKYKRVNDIGYLIGRVFINKDMHYFIEGKREIGFLYTNFANAFMDDNASRDIIKSSISYTLNFDLLTPPYETVKLLSVHEIQTTLDNMKMKTGKRLGFKFQADADEEEQAVKSKQVTGSE